MENNQCDGCKAGLLINERGNHIDTGPGGNFGCTKDRYQPITTLELLEHLGQYTITLIQDPNTKHWRLGLNWNSDSDYFFICECPTIKECLDRSIAFIQNK